MISKVNKIIARLFQSDLSHLKKGWFYLFISNPQIYFLKLIKHTSAIGILALVLSGFYYLLDMQEHKIPAIFHSLIGVVIGLLLVFRTNTAYERWWEGVKSLNSISTNIVFLISKYRASLTTTGLSSDELSTELTMMVDNLHQYLVNKDEFESEQKYNEIIVSSFNVLKIFSKNEKIGILVHRDKIILETTFKDIVKSIDDCKRIKNTPIPIAYTLHIKISIILYTLTLPFGLLHDMGLYSVLIVMLVYYIIAGIEIISNEIENPFFGDPNDIPLDDFISNIKKAIDFTSKIE